MFDENFRVPLVPFFIADFNLLIDSVYSVYKIYSVVLSHVYVDNRLKHNKFTVLPHFLVKNPKLFLLLLQE